MMMIRINDLDTDFFDFYGRKNGKKNFQDTNK